MIFKNEQKIKEILLDLKYISSEDMKKAEEQSNLSNLSLVDYLLSQEILTPEIVGQALAEYFGVEYLDLNTNPPVKELIDKVPGEITRQYNAIPAKEDAGAITIATDNPKEKGLKKTFEGLFKGKKINIVFSPTENIEALLLDYNSSLDARFVKIINEEQRVAPEIINEILNDALAYRASDVHFEPQEKEVIIRFRIDDILQKAGSIPKMHYENILNRIKVQANLRIDEHFAPQDGAIRYSKDSKKIDLRVSIAPTLLGEKIVIRLLSQYIRNFSLSELGLSDRDQEVLSSAVKKPFGMILVAGPTGSGKTTTLYALLKTINKPEVNITTIEDPVEYKLRGVNQIQVDGQNITFATGLRSIVRQDPNVILVGEIRCNETAEVAVNIALTGHLLLSTFHANDSSTAITRLIDMGVEPFLLSSTLELVIAQRLVRKICPNCRVSIKRNIEELKKIFPSADKYFSKNNSLYVGKGCSACSNTGYSGRTAIFEHIRTSRDLREIILQKPTSREIWEFAKWSGSKSLFDDGIHKVKNGITSLEELLRVASPPQK